MQTRVITGLVMPGGWHYSADGKRRPYHAESYEDLLQKEMDYRLVNNLEVGDVKADIDRYICTAFPHQCRPEYGNYHHHAPPEVAQIPRGTEKRLVDHLIDWGFEVNKPELDMVPTPEAERRAEACIQCPFNTQWRDQCPSCVAKAERLFALIRRGKDVTPWRRLNCCSLHKHDNRTAIWLRDPKAKKPSPGNCWITK